MFSNEAKYTLERAITERVMAKAATHPNAVTAHEELAILYDARLNELTRPARNIAAKAGAALAAGMSKPIAMNDEEDRLVFVCHLDAILLPAH